MSNDLESPSVKCLCLSCGQKLEFPAEMAGQGITCPTCNGYTKLTPDIPQSKKISTAVVLGVVIPLVIIMGIVLLIGVGRNHAARQPDPISPELQEDYAAYEKATQDLIKTYEDELRLEDRLMGKTETAERIHARAVKIVQDEDSGKPFIRPEK